MTDMKSYEKYFGISEPFDVSIKFANTKDDIVFKYAIEYYFSADKVVMNKRGAQNWEKKFNKLLIKYCMHCKKLCDRVRFHAIDADIKLCDICTQFASV